MRKRKEKTLSFVVIGANPGRREKKKGGKRTAYFMVFRIAGGEREGRNRSLIFRRRRK